MNLYDTFKDAHGTLYGDYISVRGSVTDEEFKRAKGALIKQACGMIEEIANTRDDFFIVKTNGDETTIGYVIRLPSVKESNE